MKNKSIITAIVFAVIAALLHYSYLKKKGTEWRKAFEPVTVVVAKVDIPEGKRIDTSMLTIKEVPKQYVQPGAITVATAAEGQYAKAPILKGEQILDSKLAAPGETWVSLNVPENMRACTIAVTEVSGVAGLIRPGNRVDIIGVFKLEDPKTHLPNTMKSLTLFQNVLVLSVGRDYMLMGPMQSNSRRKYSGSTITLAMTQRECQDLALAAKIGNLSLSLRSFFDKGRIDKSLKDKRSTPYSVTGIKAPIFMGNRWTELRGMRSISVP